MTEPAFTGMTREVGKVRTAMWCHDCRNDFTAVFDYDLNGNHVVNCPHCQHEHCRVIHDGVVTADRWDQRNGAQGAVFYGTTSTTTIWATVSSAATSTSFFTMDIWNRSTSS